MKQHCKKEGNILDKQYLVGKKVNIQQQQNKTNQAYNSLPEPRT